MLKLPESLQNLAPLSEVIRRYNLTPDKKLGQNFLFDSDITDRIVLSVADLKDATVLEIGGGPGGLTRSILASQAKKIYVVETDKRAINALKELEEKSEGRLEVIHEDALKVDESKFGKDLIIIANLPYNIGTKLVLKWLDKLELFKSITIMLQKEVVDRLAAAPSTSDYGRLSVLTQWLCKVEPQFNLPAEAFFPPPKVTSSVVKLTPYEKPLYDCDKQALEKVAQAAFGLRRKMIRKSLKSIIPDIDKTLGSLGINATKRAEELKIEEFCKISRILTKV